MTRPKKKWGQNFLRNRGAAEKIVESIGAAPDETIFEIGPGEGALTDRLLKLPNRIVAVEIDPELTARLRRAYGDRLELLEQDALEAPLPSTPYRAVGNLPYNVGTPILRRVIADENCRGAVFMLQKEVADRLVAKPGTESYGYLTIYTQLYADAKIVMTLEPRSFYPPPKVRSAVVSLTPRPLQLKSSREELIELASTSFRMRRKKLLNNLEGWRDLTREQAAAVIAKAGLDPGVRAETVTIEQFDRLLSSI